MLVSIISNNAMDPAPQKHPFIIPENINIIGNNIDELVIKGIAHIKNKGDLFEAQAGSGQQAYDINYTLLNPLNRVHNLRNPVATKYFCRELLAYFKGSLDVNEGLAQASCVWKSLADKNNKIASNYGYYIFHQKTLQDITQYEWVINSFIKNLDTRKAFININQPLHKIAETKDFPCTIGMQFFIKNKHLCCSISSRSTDVYTGLPYDMGFFSFVTELVYKTLKQKLTPEQSKDLNLGYVTMKTSFTQIYDKTRTATLKLLEKASNSQDAYFTDMPEIYDAEETMKDIYNSTSHSPVMKWIYKNAKFK